MKGLCKTTLAAALLGASALTNAGLLSSDESKDVYIVQLDTALLDGQTIAEATAALLDLVGADEPLFEYDTVLQGFSAVLTDTQVAQLGAQPSVESIERDQLVTASATQTDPVWGLDRSDEIDLPLDEEYSYPDSGGGGVHIYVIDTGINPDHQEFTGRIGEGRNFVNDGPGGLGGLLPVDVLGILLGSDDADPDNWQDCNGHGTHVAGTAGGTEFGIAKQTTLHAVRVLNCGGSGAGSAVIAGMEWVAENAERPAVVNMSLGGGASSALDDAVENLFNSNILPVVAAGNADADACSTSPARAPEAFTVASTASNDNESGFSNHGSCVDIYAPGSSIRSADFNNNSGSTVLSGTSMASPHVAGGAALILGVTPSLAAGDVAAQLVSDATVDTINPSPADAGTPNLLLNVFPQGGKP